MKLLYIDTDPTFATDLVRTLERGGVAVDLRRDGREGIDAARAEAPDAIVLAVELGDKLTAGYTWCQKLKKDDGLRNIPLVLVSSQATPETFEQHKKLKNRADEYLQKPFDAAQLLDALGHHLALPAGVIEAVAGANEAVPLVGEDDLQKLEEAFDLLTTGPGDELGPVAEDGFEIALGDELPEPEPTAVVAEAPSPEPAPVSWTAGGDLEVEELRAQLAALEARVAENERELAEKAAELEAARALGGGRDRDYFGLRNDAARKDKEILRLREDLNRAERETLELREAQTGFEQRLVDLEAELAHKDALARTALNRAESASVGLRRAEGTVAALRVEATRVPGLLEQLERIGQDKAAIAAQLDGARHDAEGLRARVAALEEELAGAHERAAAADATVVRLEAELTAAREEASATGERHRTELVELEARVSRGDEELLEAKLGLEAGGRAAARAREALATALAALDEVPGLTDEAAAGR